MKSLELSGGGHLFCSLTLLGKKIAEADIKEVEDEIEKFKAICFLLCNDESRYGRLLDDLEKSIFLGRDEYPKTIATTYELLLRTSCQVGYKRASNANGRNGRFGNPSRSRGNFSFVQSGNKEGQKYTKNNKKCIAGVDGVMHDKVHCYSCQTMRHYSGQCSISIGTNFMSVGFTFLQNKN